MSGRVVRGVVCVLHYSIILLQALAFSICIKYILQSGPGQAGARRACHKLWQMYIFLPPYWLLLLLLLLLLLGLSCESYFSRGCFSSARCFAAYGNYLQNCIQSSYTRNALSCHGCNCSATFDGVAALCEKLCTLQQIERDSQSQQWREREGEKKRENDRKGQRERQAARQRDRASVVLDSAFSMRTQGPPFTPLLLHPLPLYEMSTARRNFYAILPRQMPRRIATTAT